MRLQAVQCRCGHLMRRRTSERKGDYWLCPVCRRRAYVAAARTKRVREAAGLLAWVALVYMAYVLYVALADQFAR